MIFRYAVLFALAVPFALPGAAFADDKVDCAKAETQMDMNICAGQDYKAADKELNAAYQKAKTSMQETDSYLDAADKGAEAALLEAQRAWITFRDAACKSEGYTVFGGSIQPMIVSMCMTRLTKERTAGLTQLAEGEGN